MSFETVSNQAVKAPPPLASDWPDDDESLKNKTDQLSDEFDDALTMTSASFESGNATVHETKSSRASVLSFQSGSTYVSNKPNPSSGPNKLVPTSSKNQLDNKDADGLTTFLKAVLFGAIDAVKALVSQGANVDAVQEGTGMSAIHFAAEKGTVELVEYLLSLKPVWRELECEKNKMTPILYAAAGGNIDVLEFLVSKGAKIDTVQKSTGMLAIHLAAQKATVKMVEHLLNLRPEWLEVRSKVRYDLQELIPDDNETLELVEEVFSSVNESRKNGWTPFMHAAAGGNVEVLKFLHISKKADIDAKSENGCLAIHLSAEFGTAQSTTYLLQLNPSWLRIKSESFLMSPLHHGCISGNLSVVQRLVGIDKDVLNDSDRNSCNAVQLSARHGHFDQTVYLLTYRFDLLDYFENYGLDEDDCLRDGIADALKWMQAPNGFQSPILLAAASGNVKLLQFLKEKGANVDFMDKRGCLAIHLSAKFGSAESTRYLLELRPQWLNAEQKGGQSWTPFLFAASSGNRPVLEVLIEKGADTKVVDFKKWNALHFVVSSGKAEAITLLASLLPELLERPCASSHSGNGFTPFLLAVHLGKLPAIKALVESCANIDAKDDMKRLAIHIVTIENVIHFGAHIDVVAPGLLQSEKMKTLALPFSSSVDIAKYLLDLRPDWVDQPWNPNGEGDDEHNFSPFMLATSVDNLPLMIFLANQGARVKSTLNGDISALHLTVSTRDRRNDMSPFCVSSTFILSNSKDKRMQLKKTEFLVKLLPQFINAPIEEKELTPILLAAETGNVEVVKVLVEHGALLDAVDDDGNSALHIAAQSTKVGSSEVFEYLESLDPSLVQLMNNYGRTPRDVEHCEREEREGCSVM